VTVDDIMKLLLFVVLVVLPLLTVTMRLSLKPFVEAMIQLSEGLRGSRESRMGHEDATALERMQEDLSELREKVAQLEAADSFYRGLIETQSSSDPTASSP
jgi:hypothetical protein